MPTAQTAHIPRIVIAALRGGAGKTFLSAGIIGALKKKGLSVGVFKKGPDYIDAGWLGLAAGSQCYNLDAYLIEEKQVKLSFIRRSLGMDIAVIEGNRGLFDGVDAAGSYSTAELAKLLDAPTIIVVDATKMTRTAAALLLGCKMLDAQLRMDGVLLNKVAGARHERVLRESIESVCNIPVLGCFGKMALEHFPQRHLGLLPLYEHPAAQEFLDAAAETFMRNADLDRLIQIANNASPIEIDGTLPVIEPAAGEGNALNIGILRDSAFQFYYPENVEALQAAGASLVELSALVPNELPLLDGLYIGGGFPETHAEKLANNHTFKRSLMEQILAGLPVYAECGGLMYLSKSLRIDEKCYPMVGAFPIEVTMHRRPQGHGYIKVEVSQENPFFPMGAVLTGHEFHYSSVSVPRDDSDVRCCFKVIRGHGFDGERDGIFRYNCLGTYVHLHSLGSPSWAKLFLKRASLFQSLRRSVCPTVASKEPYSRECSCPD